MSIVTPEVKFIRLKVGEDIVTEVYDAGPDWCYSVNNPMMVVADLDIDQGRQTLIMYPWLPQGVVANNIAYIKKEDVMLISDVDPEIMDYYFGICAQIFTGKLRVKNSNSYKASDLAANKNVVEFVKRDKSTD